MATLNWSRSSSDGSVFARGRRYYYAIIIRGVPKDHPKDGVVELYATYKQMTAAEIKVMVESKQIKPISRSIFWGNLPPVGKVAETVEAMKRTAENRENMMSNVSF
jgi:hypothetical protein